MANYPSYLAALTIDHVISVAATGRLDQLASFSWYGVSSVDMGAPGVDVSNRLSRGRYDQFFRTSMARPLVAGVIALTAAANPNMSYLQLGDRTFEGSIWKSSTANGNMDPTSQHKTRFNRATTERTAQK